MEDALKTAQISPQDADLSPELVNNRLHGVAFERLRILVVEDDYFSGQCLVELCARHEFEAVLAQSGEKARERPPVGRRDPPWGGEAPFRTRDPPVGMRDPPGFRRLLSPCCEALRSALGFPRRSPPSL